MISVCIATYNGELYIQNQLDSILQQLSKGDEIIISDDHSTDRTIKLIQDYNDERIRIFINKKKGYTSNFINALSKSIGDYIFIADQDDVWLPEKVEITLEFLINKNVDLVISDCTVVDKNLKIIHKSFFDTRGSKFGLFQTIKKSGYLGCCMAFKRCVYTRSVPFPTNYKYMPYDFWLGLIGYAFFNVASINNKLILYRRHCSNSSDGGFRSTSSMFFKGAFRAYAIIKLVSNYLYFRWR